MSVKQEASEPAGESESEVFEILLPVTVFVLSDDDFLQDDAEELALSVPKREQGDEQELHSNSSNFLKSSVIPSNDSNSLSIWGENNAASSKDNSLTYSEEKCVAESVSDSPKSSLRDFCDAGKDKCSQNCMLPTSSPKADLAETNETSDIRKECDGDDGPQKIPSHQSSAGDERGGETVMPSKDSNSLSIWEENNAASSKDNSTNDSEEKCVAESVSDSPKSSLSDLCDPGKDECSQNYVLPITSPRAEFAEVNETSDRKECDGDDDLQKIPSLRSFAGDEGGGETVMPSNDSNSLSIWEENNAASSKDNSTNDIEEKCVAESVSDSPKTSLSDFCDAGKDKCSQNCMLLTSSPKADLAETNETSDIRKECDGDDGLQKIPPLLSSAGDEAGDETVKTSRQLTLVAISGNEEELVSVANVLSDGCQEIQPEMSKEMETVVEVEDPDSSKNGSNEANKRKRRKRSRSEDETLSSHLQHGLEEKQDSTNDCSAPPLNGCSPTSEELLKDVEKPEMGASTSTKSDTTGEHIYKTLTPFPKKRYRQQKTISPHASPKEFQSQQEDLGWLSNGVTIKPLSKASCSLNKQERLKCRFCSSVYKCSAHLRRHVHSAHKDKKIHKCCFCKRTFFFPVNLQNHLKFHKKMTRLQKARKNRISVRKVKQSRSEERKTETKRKESKYENFFIKIERDFTPLDMPVTFSCKSCFFASSNPRIFIHHVKGHKERPPYRCPQCDYSCGSLSFLLNHMYWHAGYKLYQCRFCTFFSLYFASMVRHSSLHTGLKPYSCEFCRSTFTSAAGLERHRRLHEGKETRPGQQLDFGSRKKRAERPVKNYTCDECHLVFYTRGQLSFHKKYHERYKAAADAYMKRSNEYRESKIRGANSDSQGRVSLSLAGKEHNYLSGGMLASEVDFEQAGDVGDNEKMYSGKKFPENGHGSNSLPITGTRSEVALNSYKTNTVVCKEEPLFHSRASRSQVQDDDAYHRFVENLKNTWPSNLCTFRTYRCQQCSYATAVHSDFKLHLKIHTDARPFVCKECNKTFKTPNHLQKHSLIHVKNGYEFGHCLCVDNRLESLGLHYEMQVGIRPERDFSSLEGSSGIRSLFGSEVCGLQPDVQGGRENDLLAQSQPQFYQCAECEYSTYILSNLELHVRTHTGEKPYSCSVCQKKFRTSSHLRRHRVTHFNVEHLKCGSCDYSTNKWLALKRHLASHSCEGSSTAGALYEQNLLPVKVYRCEECGYCTAHNGNLKPHLRIHTGEKPFKCSQCSLAFRTSSHLKRHLLTHLRLRCRKCKFSTIDKHAFQKHVKTHKKKYKCGKCNVMLPTRKLLEKHKQQHKLGV